MPVLSNLAGPIQHFRAAVLEGWRSKVSADLCAKKGFRGGPWLDLDGTLQPLNSGNVRERNKALLRGILQQPQVTADLRVRMGFGCAWYSAAPFP